VSRLTYALTGWFLFFRASRLEHSCAARPFTVRPEHLRQGIFCLWVIGPGTLGHLPSNPFVLVVSFRHRAILGAVASGLLQLWGGQIRSVRNKSERLRPSLNSDEEEQ
jgi:hypothetical protein